MHFQDKSVPFEDPAARPWELTCRHCLADDNPDDIILCDCCDAEYHTYCLSPPLPRVPEELWQCPRCQSYVKTGVRLHSHTLEEAARRRAEEADSRHKIVRVMKYLVKWRGLSYRDCTWETKEEVNDDAVIARYYELNADPPKEPPMSMDEVQRELNPRGYGMLPAIDGPSQAAELGASIYAQIRAYHYLRMDMKPPDALLRESGLAANAYLHCSIPKRREDANAYQVSLLLNELVGRVADGSGYQASYGPLLPQEIEVTVPKIGNSLFMNVAEHGAYVRVESFRKLPDGSMAPVARNPLIRPGLFIVGVNGIECDGLGFDDIVGLLKSVPTYVTLRLSQDIVQRAAIRGHIRHMQGVDEADRARAAASANAMGDESLPGSLEWMSSLGLLPHTIDPVSDSDSDEDAGSSAGTLSRLLRAAHDASTPPNDADWSSDVFRLKELRPSGPIYSMPESSYADSRRKAIEQLDLVSGEIIKVWDSLTSASRTLNIQISCISCCVTGRQEQAGGYKWRYASYPVPEQPDIDTAISTPVPTTSSSSVAAGGKSSPSAGDAPNNHTLDGNRIPTESVLGGDADGPSEDEHWRSRLPSKSKDFKGNVLRDYQVEGVRWMLSCWYRQRSCILADEMGLGKTVQVTCVLEHLFSVEDFKGPFLVVVPLSTIEHWRREIEGWTDMEICMYHDAGGGREMRDVIREYEWYYAGRSRRVIKFHVLITTYDDLIRDFEELSEISWRSVVVDEAHRLRNRDSKLLECLKSILLRGLTMHPFQHRILMTGTPLQNNIDELWSLMNFVEPDKFADRQRFLDRFGDMATEEQVRALQQRISPHMLRRVKEDVASDIPPKEETLVDVELTMLQKQYYRAIFEKNHAILYKVGGASGRSNMPSLMNIQMELRKCCNHPFLVRGVEDHEVEQMLEAVMAEAGADAVDEKQLAKARLEKGLVQSSGKMILLDKLLPKLKREGHKVLIFSQFIMMLDMLAEYCSLRGYARERLDGRVTGNERQKAIDRFNTSADSFIFLLSTRAGGVGINLTAADTCIIFDSDWNPQNDVQAMARCHRIGQTKEVKVYRLISRRSFESEMFARASRKLGLEQAVLGNPTQNEKLSASEMEKLLREGAYALMEEGTSALEEFNAMDIDKILEQRSRVIVQEEPKDKRTAEWLRKKDEGDEEEGGQRRTRPKSTLRKSKFQSEAMEEQLDVDDPNFWQKVLPDLVTPFLLIQRLEDGEPEQSTAAARVFYKDLEKMVKGLMVAQSKGTLDPAEQEQAVQLLVQVSVKTDVFDCSQAAGASLMAQQLQGSRLRQSVRMDQGGFGYDEDGVGGEFPRQKNSRSSRGRKSSGARGVGDDEFVPEQRQASGVPAAAASVTNSRERDINMDLCAICEIGGEILLCDGPCTRSFHPECLELDDFPTGDVWVCPDCQAGIHACLLCGESGPSSHSSMERGNPVVKCSLGGCGRFYHERCARKDGRVRWFTGRQGAETFKCPQHYCKMCLKSSAEFSAGRSPLLKCMRCPNAYHEPCAQSAPADAGDCTSLYLKKGKLIVCGDHDLDAKERALMDLQHLKRGGAPTGTSSKSKKARIVMPDAQYPSERRLSKSKNAICGLCSGKGDSADSITGPFIRPPFLESSPGQDDRPLFVHRSCALYTPEVYAQVAEEHASSAISSLTPAEIAGALFFNVVKAKKRSRFLKCSLCGNNGASIGCNVKACNKSYHFACAVNTTWRFGEVPDAKGKLFLCQDHRKPGQTSAGGGKRGRKRTNDEGATPNGNDAMEISPPKKRKTPRYSEAFEQAIAPWVDSPSAVRRTAIEIILEKIRAEDKDSAFEDEISDEQAPGYSDVTEKPMCLRIIEKRLRRGRYTGSTQSKGLHLFRGDLELVFDNCLAYNSPSSVLWTKANELKKRLDSYCDSAFIDAQSRVSLMEAEKEAKGASKRARAKSKAEQYLRPLIDAEPAVQEDALKRALKALSKEDSADIFESLVDEEDAPDYYEAIERPICLEMIRKWLQKGRYSASERGVMGFKEDVDQMLDNCQEYNSADSKLWEEAGRIRKRLPEIFRSSLRSAQKKQSAPKENSVTDADTLALTSWLCRPWGRANDPPLAVQTEAMRLVLKKMAQQDPHGVFEYPVQEDDAPGYYEAIERPMCRHVMQESLDRHEYTEPPEGRGASGFASDAVLMFTNCKAYNAVGSELWHEAGGMLKLLPGIFRDAIRSARRAHNLSLPGRRSPSGAEEPNPQAARGADVILTSLPESAYKAMDNKKKRQTLLAALSACQERDGGFSSSVALPSNGIVKPLSFSLLEQRITKGRYFQRSLSSFIQDVNGYLQDCQAAAGEGSEEWKAVKLLEEEFPGIVSTAFSGTPEQSKEEGQNARKKSTRNRGSTPSR
jgi:superfamily II DNA or RNA helicase